MIIVFMIFVGLGAALEYATGFLIPLWVGGLLAFGVCLMMLKFIILLGTKPPLSEEAAKTARMTEFDPVTNQRRWVPYKQPEFPWYMHFWRLIPPY